MISRMIDERRFDPFDWQFIGVIGAVLAIGVLSIYSVTYIQPGAGLPFYLKQIIWIGLGAVAFMLMLAIDYHKIARLSYLLYAIVLVLLVVVLFMGKSSRGAQRWIPIGPFAFQPSEFAKLVLILVLASYYAAAPRSGWMQRVLIPGAIMLPGLLLILKQPDLGSGLSFLAVSWAVYLLLELLQPGQQVAWTWWKMLVRMALVAACSYPLFLLFDLIQKYGHRSFLPWNRLRLRSDNRRRRAA